MMNKEFLKEFVPYEVVLRLKSLGFDKPCFGFYNNAEVVPYIKHELNDELREIYKGDFEAPTFSQAFRFFRDEYDLLGIPTHSKYSIMSNKWVGQNLYGDYNSYEEAELACLEKLLEIVESKSE